MSTRIMDTDAQWSNAVCVAPEGPRWQAITADYAVLAVMIGARVLQTVIVLWPIWSSPSPLY